MLRQRQAAPRGARQGTVAPLGRMTRRSLMIPLQSCLCLALFLFRAGTDYCQRTRSIMRASSHQENVPHPEENSHFASAFAN